MSRSLVVHTVIHVRGIKGEDNNGLRKVADDLNGVERGEDKRALGHA